MDPPTASIIDQATATIIVGVIGAITSVAVALITTRSRIDVPRPTSINEIQGGVYSRQSRSLRVLGWAFVVLLYVISTVCYLIFIFFSSIAYSLAGLAGVVMYVLPSGLLGLLFLAIARWGQKRLKRSHV
jgi:hypothetical protein